AGGGLGFDLDACEIGHAVENNWNRGSLGDHLVVIHQSVLRDRRAIVVWGNNQHRFGAGARGSFDLLDCAARALLARARDESEFFRNSLARSFDYLDVLAFVEMNSLAG